MNIENAVILITGANRGLGKSLVEQVLKAGARKVYAASRDPKSIVATDKRVVPVKLDVTNAADVKALAAQMKDLTLLINNAGVASPDDFLKGTLEAAERDMRVNYYGTLEVIRAVQSTLIANAPSAIVNVLSMASFANFPILNGYSVSKAAAHSMTQGVRAGLAKSNVQVIGVYPGPIDTEMTKSMEMQKTAPADIAKAIVEGIIAGNEDILPDAMSQQVGTAYASAPKSVEKMFAAG